MSIVQRLPRSERELRAAAYDLYYEFWMFAKLANGLAVGILGEGIINNAVLESFFPLRGVPGTSVTLKGQHFHQGMQLRLAGKPLTIDQLRPGTVVVTIPEGATSGRFSIETHGRQLTSRLPFAVDQPKPELSFTFAPPVARRGTDVTLTLDPPRQGVTVYLDDRPLPKRVLENGRRLVVTVPGDARSRGDLEVEYRGRKYRADRPLRIR